MFTPRKTDRGADATVTALNEAPVPPVDQNVISEPLAMLGLGLLGIGALRRRAQASL